MFYLFICMQRGQGDWTLQEADRTDQRTGHCAVSWKQLQRPVYSCGGGGCHAAVCVNRPAAPSPRVQMGFILPLVLLSLWLFSSSSPQRKQNYETKLDFYPPYISPNWALKVTLSVVTQVWARRQNSVCSHMNIIYSTAGPIKTRVRLP